MRGLIRRSSRRFGIGRTGPEKRDYRQRRLLRARDKRPRDRCSAQGSYKFSPSDADCHSPRARCDHDRCDLGKNITYQSAGLALASLAVTQQIRSLSEKSGHRATISNRSLLTQTVSRSCLNLTVAASMKPTECRGRKRPLKVRMSDGPRLGVGLQNYARLAEIRSCDELVREPAGLPFRPMSNGIDSGNYRQSW